MSSPNSGRVFWITGLPGSGKTTLGSSFHAYLQNNGNPAIHLDGDVLRDLLGRSDRVKDYSQQTRLELAAYYSRLARMISDQGVDVIVSTVSLFHSVHIQNRSTIDKYFEIFLDVSSEILLNGPRADMYANGWSVDSSPEFPTDPDLVLSAESDVQRELWLASLLSFFLRVSHAN